MSKKIVDKINELEEEIVRIDHRINAVSDEVWCCKYGLKKELVFIINELLYEQELEKNMNNCQNNCKNLVKQSDILNFFYIKDKPNYVSNKEIIVDGIKYLLVKNNSRSRYSSLNNNNDYYTYKITSDNNNNYIKDTPKNKKRICCHCGSKLNFSIITSKEEKNQMREYYCYTCDTVKLDFTSTIKHTGNIFFAKDINWCHSFHTDDEICNFSNKDFELTNSITISIDKRCEILNIDNQNYNIYWYYDSNNICKYAFSSLYNRLLLCKNSIIIHKNNTIKIENNDNNKSLYKLVINGIELSGHRFRPDLLKCNE
jgi:hypothetical protein